MKGIRLAEIKNNKNETLKDYCDRLWEVAENMDAKAEEYKEKNDSIYNLLFDYSSELQQVICDLQMTLEIKVNM